MHAIIINSPPGLVFSDVTPQGPQYLPALKKLLMMPAAMTDFDEDLLARLPVSIDVVGQYCGLSMQPRMVMASYASYGGDPLPLGPVWADPVPVVTPTPTGSTVTINITGGSAVSGGLFPALTGIEGPLTVAYKAGYSRGFIEGAPALPDGLFGAVIEHAAAGFRAGGMAGHAPATYWKTLAGPYRRMD